METLPNLVLDDSPGDCVGVSCGFLHGLLCHIVESHNVVEHAHSLVEGTVAVVLGVRVLLEKVILNKFSHFQNDLV